MAPAGAHAPSGHLPQRGRQGYLLHAYYSDAAYIISVTITLDENSCLVASITCNGEEVDQVVVEFENVYDHTPPSDPGNPPTGDFALNLWMTVLLLSGTGLTVTAKRRKKAE